MWIYNKQEAYQVTPDTHFGIVLDEGDPHDVSRMAVAPRVTITCSPKYYLVHEFVGKKARDPQEQQVICDELRKIASNYISQLVCAEILGATMAWCGDDELYFNVDMIPAEDFFKGVHKQ